MIKVKLFWIHYGFHRVVLISISVAVIWRQLLALQQHWYEANVSCFQGYSFQLFTEGVARLS